MPVTPPAEEGLQPSPVLTPLRLAPPYATAYTIPRSILPTATANQTRSVRLFRNGRSQAIRIPREFALPGVEATITRDSKGRLIVEAARKPTVVDLLDSWEPLSEEDAMPRIEDFPPKPFDL